MKKRTLEDQVAAIYNLMGYRVRRAPHSGHDPLAWIVTRRIPGIGSASFVVECKSLTKAVDADEVVRFLSQIEPLIVTGEVAGGILVSSTRFSTAAHSAAAAKPLALFTLSDLAADALQLRGYLHAAVTVFEESFSATDYVELQASARKWGKHEVTSVRGNVTNLMDRWLKRIKQRFIFLFGGPGSGKSTVCLKLAHDLAKSYAPGKRIPVLLEARTLIDAQSIQHAILRKIQPSIAASAASPDLVDILNSRGELLLLIDGLDEVPSSEVPALLDGWLRFASPAVSKIAITCRSSFFETRAARLRSSTILDLNPLNEAQINSFLEAKAAGLSNKARQIHGLMNMASSPLLLNLVARMLLETNRERQLSVGSIYEAYVNAILDHDYQKSASSTPSPTADLDLLSALAMQMYSSGAISVREGEIEWSQNINFDRFRTLPFISRDVEGKYEFLHKSFLEFFVARLLAVQLREKEAQGFARVILTREVLELLADLDVPTKLLREWTEVVPAGVSNQKVFLENIRALYALVQRGDKTQVPRLRVRELKLSQIKCFEEATFRFIDGEGISLIVGDNGIGKSTALQAIALCALGPDLASNLLSLPDRWLRNDASKGYLQATFDVSGLESQPSSQVVVGLEISRGTRHIKLVTKGPFASKNVDKLLDARSKVGFSGLLVAGYGASRTFHSHEDLRTGSPRDILIDSVASLFDWSKYPFEPGSVSRLVIGDGTPFQDFGAPSTLTPAIRDSVAETLLRLLPNNTEGRFTLDGAYASWYGTAEIEGLSDGYRSTLAWACHLIVQLLAAGNWSKNLEEIPGLVLIDELDLHLHPQWQRVAVENVRAAFPNLQFVASTHSPLVIADAETGIGSLLLLRRDGNRAIVDSDVPSVKGWRADQILASELFGYIIEKDPGTERALREASILAGKGARRNAAEEQKYREILATLEKVLIPSGQTLVERDIQKRKREELITKAHSLESELFGDEK